MNLVSANGKVKKLTDNQKSQELRYLHEVCDSLVAQMTNEELDILISCDTFEEYSPEFIEKWGDKLEVVGRLEYHFLRKWGGLNNVT